MVLKAPLFIKQEFEIKIDYQIIIYDGQILIMSKIYEDIYDNSVYFSFFPHVGDCKHYSYIEGQKDEIMRVGEFDIKLNSQANICLVKKYNETFHIIFDTGSINIVYEHDDISKCATIESDDLLVSMFRLCFDVERVPYQKYLSSYNIKIENKLKPKLPPIAVLNDNFITKWLKMI